MQFQKVPIVTTMALFPWRLTESTTTKATKAIKASRKASRRAKDGGALEVMDFQVEAAVVEKEAVATKERAKAKQKENIKENPKMVARKDGKAKALIPSSVVCAMSLAIGHETVQTVW